MDPTNHRLFSGSDDHTIKVWSLTDGAYWEEQKLRVSRNYNGPLAVDQTNHRLFSVSDYIIKVWSLTDGAYREEQTLMGHKSFVNALVVDSARHRLFSGSPDHDIIKVWHLNTS